MTNKSCNTKFSVADRKKTERLKLVAPISTGEH